MNDDEKAATKKTITVNTKASSDFLNSFCEKLQRARSKKSRLRFNVRGLAGVWMDLKSLGETPEANLPPNEAILIPSKTNSIKLLSIAALASRASAVLFAFFMNKITHLITFLCVLVSFNATARGDAIKKCCFLRDASCVVCSALHFAAIFRQKCEMISK